MAVGQLNRLPGQPVYEGGVFFRLDLPSEKNDQLTANKQFCAMQPLAGLYPAGPANCAKAPTGTG